MSGSGHHDGKPLDGKGTVHKASGKLKNELLSALRLLFKSVNHHGVPLLAEPDITFYLPEPVCESVAVGLETPKPALSDDPIRQFEADRPSAKPLALIDAVELAETTPCRIEPVLCSQPVFESMHFEALGVSFKNLTTEQSLALPIEAFTSQAKEQPIEFIALPALNTMPPDTFKTIASSRSALEALTTVKTRQDSRLLVLPIRKPSIPPHRFSMATREKFRQILAEKAKIQAANVQLKTVFANMHMGLYASIQQDELGNLLCIPKKELLGQTLSASTTNDAVYLVVGIQLDTQADIRALIPMNSIANSPAEGKSEP